MRFFTLLCCLMAASLSAQTIMVADDDLQGGNAYFWTSDNTYILDGVVVLEAGGTLNIEAGTVIKGKDIPTNGTDNNSSLVIAKGAQIRAIGTAEAPIIFTTEFDDLEDEDDITFDDRGLWGGIIILGEAPIATPTGTEILGDIEYLGDAASYGGTIENDDSGILQHVSIRHPGASSAPGYENNGLTLAGVGSKTIIDHIEVYACQDDAIEMRGGTVNLKHLSIAFASDESIDWDLGWRGKGQFWLALQDEESDRCGEHDGAAPDNAEPFSSPIISNVTYIGPGVDAENNASEALQFRDRSAGIYTNSIFINFPEYAIDIEDRSDIADSYDHLQTGALLFNCNYWWDFGAGDSWSDLVRIRESYEDQTASFLINLMETTQNTIADPLLMDISPEPELFDPRLSPNSPALNGGCAIDDEFFDPVNYIGAFDSEGIWLTGWSGMQANEFFAFIVNSTKEPIVNSEHLDLFPNPATDEITLTLKNTAANQTAQIELFTINGTLVKQMRTNTLENTTISVSDLTAGMYLLQVRTNDQLYTQKFVIAK